MKDNLNPSSKSLHRTERPPPPLFHGDYDRVLEREQARLVIKEIASFLNTMKTERYSRKAVGNGRLVEDYMNTATSMMPGAVFCMADAIADMITNSMDSNEETFSFTDTCLVDRQALL